MHEKNKIAIVLNTAWNIYNFRLGLIKTLQKQGFDVVAIAPEDEYAKKIIVEGIRFIPIYNLKRKGTSPARDAKLIAELSQIYKAENIDLVLHYTIKPVIYGTIAASRIGVKSINTLTGLGYSFLSVGLVSKLVQYLYRFSLKKADKVFFQNQDDLKLFLENKLVGREKVDLIRGSGIDTDRFKLIKDNRDLKKMTFLFIGRLLQDKGVTEFIEAAQIIKEKHPTASFHIVGHLDNSNPSAIQRELLQLWVKQGIVRFYGHVPDTRPYISAADVVVLPSYREGLPRVMLEGMSMSRPLIATDVPGCRETIVNGINGFLCKAKDGKALAKAMEKMMGLTQSQRAEMGKAGRRMALKQFDERIIVGRYLKEIHLLAGTKQKTALPRYEHIGY